MHLYMEETVLDYPTHPTPPPPNPISFCSYTTDLLKAKSYTTLIHI